jgi:SAM-dependent methyltransferase
LEGPGRSRAWAAWRIARDAVLRLRYRGDHIRYYRAVMQDTVRKGAARAVDNSDRRHWRKGGKAQFDYLVKHGLQPHHKLLEIGCGNLRAGYRFIDYLEAGNYYGTEISSEVLARAQETLEREGLAAKQPRLTLVDDMRFEFLADAQIDMVHAHSVFSHSPLSVIEECFRSLPRVLRPRGYFFFTFNRTEGKERHVLREDFYYRTQTLIDLAHKCGLEAQFMDDWEELGQRQSTIKVWPKT